MSIACRWSRLYFPRCPPIMNKLHVGFSKSIELPKGGFLFIDDKAPEILRAKVFDPLRHCFNPLKISTIGGRATSRTCSIRSPPRAKTR